MLLENVEIEVCMENVENLMKYRKCRLSVDSCRKCRKLVDENVENVECHDII